MAADTKKITLTTAMTWAGKDYAVGENEMPAAAAAFVVKQKYGSLAPAAEPKPESPPAGDNAGDDDNPPPPEGLPKDFPMCHVFEREGFKTVAEIQAKTRDELIEINGIAGASADKALAYKSEK